MKTTEVATDVLLDELLAVFYQKLIYYVPSEIITENALNEIDTEFKDDLLDELCFIDEQMGVCGFSKEDSLELNTLLMDKRSFLQKNTFKLLEKSKELNALEFNVIIVNYHEFLSLFIYITEWMRLNVKKYNGDSVNLGIVGSFGIQLSYFVTHLNDINNYFGVFIGSEITYDFSMQNFVMKYMPELVSRYVKIAKNTKEKSEGIQIEKLEQTPIVVPSVKKKRQRPQLDDGQVEAILLEHVFNVRQEDLVQN